MTARLVRPSWTEAREAAHAAGLAARRPAEVVPLRAAAARTLGADVRSLTRVPGFDASAMDGWAVAGDGPWTLGDPVVAGPVVPSAPLLAGQARPITTGAVVPVGADRVLRSESGRLEAGRLVDDGDPGGRHPRHVRLAGEEAEPGDLLFTAGTTLTPPRLAVAAVCGLDEVTVVRQPRAALAVLGDEVTGSGIPAAGTVRDVFSPSVPDILRSLGAVCDSAARVQDDLDETVEALGRSDVDLLITTGGTAHSSTDHVRAALDRLGAELVVEGVAMRPGQPLLLARRPGILHLCLPGNPMAALTCLVAIGVPLLDGLLGRPQTRPGSVSLAVDVEHPRPGVLLQAYRLDDEGLALPVARQSSAMLRGLAEADGLLVVPEGGARRGDPVRSLALPW